MHASKTPKTPPSGSNGLPPMGAHGARPVAGAPSDPDVILATLPMGTPDYLRVLGAILKKHNHLHATKHKGVGFDTMVDRQRMLVSFFRELRRHTPYRNVDPRQLANRISWRWSGAGWRVAWPPRRSTTT